MHVDQDLPSALPVKGNRLYVWVDLSPLLRPVSPNFFRPTDKTAFERSRPSHVRSHEGEGGVNVSCIEGRVRRTEQFDFCCRLIWHNPAQARRGRARVRSLRRKRYCAKLCL